MHPEKGQMETEREEIVREIRRRHQEESGRKRKKNKGREEIGKDKGRKEKDRIFLGNFLDLGFVGFGRIHEFELYFQISNKNQITPINKR